MSQVHSQARTTPITRAKIRSCADSSTELALRYNTTVATIRKWPAREDMQDRSPCPHTLNATLTPGPELLVIKLRRLPLDDLLVLVLVLVREFINPAVSRSGLNRCLVRHGVATLASLDPPIDDTQTKPLKTFKDYEPGFIHMDIKYLPPDG